MAELALLDDSNAHLQNAAVPAYIQITSLLFTSVTGRGAALSGAAPAFFMGRTLA
jgi:hypothetical protein